ncbi:MAG: hypothetical protein ACKO2Z_06650 [Sphaerospermopsis kisseleviana]|jgi:hypothetical protein|uniref:Uncharacterized protein n=1 Tax=Sphaerospermopsis reniformis TaxID=531300 RepID=A0A480A7Y7_9CYAN|nr:hypothetical protein SR1949_34280 [Sphaerospermopsis reniformis]
MPPWGPVKRRDLINYPKILGFDGLFPGGKHQYMIKLIFVNTSIVLSMKLST